MSTTSTTYFPVPFHLQTAATMPTVSLPAVNVPAVSIPALNAPVMAPSSNMAYTSACTMPQYQQAQAAQQLFQKDAQVVNPVAIENVKAAIASNEVQQNAQMKKRAIPRKAAGQTWEDPMLADWPESACLVKTSPVPTWVSGKEKP